MAINLFTETQAKTAERFKLSSVTEGIFSKEYTWAGVKTIEILTPDLVSLSTYDRTATTASRFGSMVELGDVKNTYTMADEKSYEISLDKGNVEEQKRIKTAANTIRRETDDVVIPYVDKYRLGKLATGAGTKIYSYTIAKSTIVEKLMLARATMGNNNVPQGNDVLYMGETAAVNVKLATEVIGCDKIAEAPIVNGIIGKIAGMQVRIVPDSYMPENVVFMIVHKGCAWAPKKIETSRILTEHPFVDGAVLQYRLNHDCFVNAIKNKGIYVAYSSADPAASAASAASGT